MWEKEFALRLAQLRTKKGVSAREMSLSIGQNPSYINSIENGKALPSMMGFFFICQYLDIAPAAFFDTKVKDPSKTDALINDLKKLNDEQLNSIAVLVKHLSRS